MKRSILFASFVAALAVAPHGAPAQDAAPTATVRAQPDREVQIAADAFVKDATLPRWVQPHAIPDFHTPGAAVLALADSQFLVADQPVLFVHRAIRINDASVLSTVEPVVSVVVAGLVLGERLSATQITGGAVVLLAVAVLARSGATAGRRDEGGWRTTSWLHRRRRARARP